MKANPKKASLKKASKPTSKEIKCYLDPETYKKFKKKAEEHGTHRSQWIRHQIMKWVK